MKFGPLPPEKVIKALSKIGFEAVRRKGSHVFMQHLDGRTTVVPFHKGRELGRGILRKIIEDAKLTEEEFQKFLDEV